MKKTKMQNGFTLIEILIAMMIFAILSGMTSFAIKRMAEQIKHVQSHYQFLNTLNKVVHDLENNSKHLIKRGIRANEERRFPIFIGQHDYAEWTTSDAATQKLKRIAYLCRNHQLVFRQWDAIDPLSRQAYQDKVIINDIKTCRFRYLHFTGNIEGYFNSGAEETPKGMQVLFSFQQQKELKLWFHFEPWYYERQMH